MTDVSMFAIYEKICFLPYAKTKAQISCAVTTKLINAFVISLHR